MAIPIALQALLDGVTDQAQRNKLIAQYKSNPGLYDDMYSSYTPKIIEEKPAPEPEPKEDKSFGPKVSASAGAPDQNIPSSQDKPSQDLNVSSKDSGSAGISSSGPWNTDALGGALGQLNRLDRQSQARTDALMAPGDNPPNQDLGIGAEDPSIPQTGGAFPGLPSIPKLSEEQRLQRDRGLISQEFERINAKQNKSLSDYNRLQDLSILHQSTIGQQKAVEESAYREKFQQQEQQKLQEEMEIQQKIKSDIDKKFSQVENIQNELANKKVDPTRWMQKNKFAAIAGILLSAVGQAILRHNGIETENLALKAVNKSIDQDIASQQMEIEQLKDKRAGSINLLHLLERKLGSEQQAQSAFRMIRLNQFQQGLESISSRYQSQDVQARADQARAGIQQEYMKLQNDLAFQSEQSTRANIQLKANIAAQREAMSLRKFGMLAEMQNAKGPRDYIPGLEYYIKGTPDTEQLKNVRAYWSLYQGSERKLEQLIQIRKEYDSENLPTDAKREMEELTNQLIIDLKTMKGMGAHFTEMEKELLNLRDAGSWKLNYIKSLETKKKQYALDAKDYLGTYGFRRVDNNKQYTGQNIK